MVEKYTPPYPLLTGTVSKELRDGLVVIDQATGKVDPTRLFLYCRRLIDQRNYEHKPEAVEACVREYNDTGRVVYVMDDATLFVPTYNLAANAIRKGQPAFLYEFEYDGIGAAWNRPPMSTPENSPRHSQELMYLFGQAAGTLTEKDRRIQYLFSEIFANFINHGNPNGIETHGFEPLSESWMNFFKADFPPNSSDTSHFVGNTPNYHRRAVEFWNERMPQ